MPAPDLIIVNADIVTMDPLTPRAEALAVAAGRIAALGRSAEIAALAGPDTRIVDAGGRLVLLARSEADPGTYALAEPKSIDEIASAERI